MISGPVTSCGSCGCPDLDPVLDLGMQPLPQAVRDAEFAPLRYPLRLVQCAWCTLVQLDYIVPQAMLFPAGYPYATGNTAALRQHFADLAVKIEGVIRRGELVVDIGGNDGTMLKELRAIAPDNRLLLVEPTAQARKCRTKGIGVVRDYFTAELAGKIREVHGPAAVITTSSVFGHVPDPHDFLTGVTELLDGDGTLVIENQDWHNIVNGLQIDTVYHEHLRYYSPASLGHLLARHGLLITHLTRLAMHGGSFRAVCNREQPGLKGRVGVLVTKLLRLLDEAACQGPLFAVGAPTRATSLVNYASLGAYLECACEIAGSDKIGAVIPGTHIPVVDEQALIDRQPPNALLLAWDLEATIIPALRRRGYKGKFILPLPEPRYADG